VYSWWQALKGQAPPSGWEHYRGEVRRGLQNADLVIAPSGSMLRALEYHYGPILRALVIANGRDVSRYRAAAKGPFIFAAGRVWDEAKNIAALDHVAANLPWPIYVAGDARHPDGGHAVCPEVHTLGPLPSHAVARWLAQAAIYALPARYEPFGLSILEAGLSGCALVLGDIPSLREVWGDAALFVSLENTTGLHESLMNLIRNDELRRDYAQRALARALRYSSERMAANYLDAYRRIASGRLVKPEDEPASLRGCALQSIT
jgi:glycosyltransferase involved in cell wall biosynthesis